MPRPQLILCEEESIIRRNAVDRRRKGLWAEMKKRFDLFAYRIILAVTFFLSILICAGAVAYAQENLFVDLFSSSIRLILPILLSVMICVLIMLLYRCFDRLDHRRLVICVCVMFGLMAAGFTIMICCFRSVPYSDALNVQDTAMYFAKTGSRSLPRDGVHAEYFGKYSNNYFLTILCSWLFRLLLKAGIQDIYTPLVVLSVTGIMTAVLFMYLTGVRIGGIRTGAKILALCVMNALYYVLVLWVYANVLSIPVMMAVVYFGICIYQEKRRGHWIFACIMEAASSVIGYFIRPTAVIPLIAFMICAVLWAVRKKENRYRLIRCAGICMVTGVILFQGISRLNERYFSSVSDKNFPITHWLMMGSHGEGKHNFEDLRYTESFDTKKEKTNATVRKLMENYREAGKAELVSFFYNKILVSWSPGDGIEILPKAAQDMKQTKLYSWILGDRMDLFRLYCCAFRIASLLLIIVGIQSLLRKKEIHAYQFVFVLSLFGGILFYCFWEVKGSYTAPFIYTMLLTGMQGADVLADMVPAIRERLKIRERYWEISAVFAGILFVCLVSFHGMTDTAIDRKDFGIYNSGKRSVRPIREAGGIRELTQEFYAEKPLNCIELCAEADRTAKRSDAGYHVRLLDEEEREIYTGEIHAKEILPEGRIVLKTQEIVPKGRQKYKLVLQRLEAGSGNLYMKQRSNEYIDLYEGVLTVNGKERMNDLFLQTYRAYRGKWCSKRAGAVLCGSLFAAAVLLYLWLRREENHEQDKTSSSIIYSDPLL